MFLSSVATTFEHYSAFSVKTWRKNRIYAALGLIRLETKITLGLSNPFKIMSCPWCKAVLGKHEEHAVFSSLFFGMKALQLCHKPSKHGTENNFLLIISWLSVHLYRDTIGLF